MEGNHLVKPGLTPVEAVEFLREDFPDVPHWTYLHVGSDPDYNGLNLMLGSDFHENGRFGKWQWKRVKTRYPRIALMGDVLTRPKPVVAWIGAVRVTNADGASFIVFSYLSHRDEICRQYLLSTDDQALIKAFIKAAISHYRPKKRKQIRITVMNGPDIFLRQGENETIFLPDEMQADIDSQVQAFFEGSKTYKKLGVRHQRGFLFVGAPGTGKTMTIRRLVRMCHQKYKARFFSLVISRKTDEDALACIFGAAQCSAPAVIILEDMDSLTRESMVTRSALLSYLDGMKSNKGILIVGTSNNPESIDPALVHRPSRFDRVWQFPVPDLVLRSKYVSHHFPQVAADVAETLVRKTANWSYAYLNELRVTSGILSIRAGHASVTEEHLLQALTLLARQFESGRKNYAPAPSVADMGFKAA